MNQKRHDMLIKFVIVDGWNINFKVNKLAGKIDLIVSHPLYCELPHYKHGKLTRISFYDKETKKVWDYSIYELMAHKLNLDWKLKWTKNNVNEILKPKLKELFL